MPLREQLVVGEDIGAGTVAAKRQYRRMLHQKQRIVDGLHLACCDDLSLDAQTLSIGDAAELKEVKVHKFLSPA
jgi:hypothetical protein